VSWTVSPSATSVVLLGVTATVATVGGVTGGGSVVPPPQPTRAEPATSVSASLRSNSSTGLQDLEMHLGSAA
jgi:hypothetical protein